MKHHVMSYTRDVSKLHIEPPAYTFPGDEAISGFAYKAAMNNTYLRKVPLATALMERFKVPFTKQDQECIKRMIVAMGWLDHLLDESPSPTRALEAYKKLLNSLSTGKMPEGLPEWLRPELLDMTLLLQNAVAQLPPEAVQAITAKALRIGEISKLKAASNKVKVYAGILTEEGSLSSDLAIECLGKPARASKNYRKLYVWNEQAIIAATLLDAAKDLKQDYADGLTLVRPTRLHKAYLLGKALSYSRVVAGGLGLRGMRAISKVGVN
ncbi:MAG TPA: hypothetical protein VLF62_01415 [Candidatus Saccharimonadales bacterium]|nr:hypothetical protein [Candidatus Saccharimonadales bacterium]